MNAERFAFYIKNPAHLYQITYTELKSLVLQYPYCQNLRYLLLKKSILENHQESERNLQLAATYSTDRNFLYQQIKSGDSYVSEADSFLIKKGYLELKELQSGQSINEPPPPRLQKEDIENTARPSEESDDLNKDEAIKEDLEANVAIPPFQQEEQIADSPFFLDEIDEEEFVDITDEMEGIFVTEDMETLEFGELAPNREHIKEEVEKEKDDDIETASNQEVRVEDEAISIEELIEMDNLSPLERLEKLKSRQKAKEKESDENSNDHTEEMKKKEKGFEEIETLIEKAKKDLSLEITNEDALHLTEDHSPKPSPKASFGSWLKQFQVNEEKGEPHETKPSGSKKEKSGQKKSKKKKKESDKKEKTILKKESKLFKKEKKKGKTPKPSTDKIPEKAKKVAKKSLEQNAEIVSETLANLLVKQKNYKQAIDMYERLSLIFPEKSSFFAEQIKKLKNK